MFGWCYLINVYYIFYSINKLINEYLMIYIICKSEIYIIYVLY